VVWETKQSSQAAIIVLFTVLVLAGDQVRRRARAQRNLAAQEERSVVLAERTRIARELHDVVAHHMSMIAVRAETAPYRLGEVGAPARAEFGEISAAAREAAGRMRPPPGCLAQRPAAGADGAAAGLADLTELVDSARRAGATVHLEVTDDVSGRIAAVELTAFRIVQEALSNASQHAPGAAATVAVRCTATNPRRRGEQWTDGSAGSRLGAAISAAERRPWLAGHA